MSTNGEVKVFAPATVANVVVGFDILGFALEGVGDEVTVALDPRGRGVRIESIDWNAGEERTPLPEAGSDNTAGAALESLLAAFAPESGFRVRIRKGIPVGSGMGGSAASAVGAVVAGARALGLGLGAGPAELLPHALAGERVASGGMHADNVAPCLFGGLTAVLGMNPPDVRPVAVPDGVSCVVVHPRMRIDTSSSRAGLAGSVLLSQHVRQSANLAGFLLGCERSDIALIRKSMTDVVVEPQRSHAIPGFDRAKRDAIAAGAVGFGIAGSGPSVFAWAESAESADGIGARIVDAFRAESLAATAHLSAISKRGARVIS